MRVAIVTRGYLYPTHHGAAVKIVRTAEYLSMLGDDAFIVTDNRDFYLCYSKGQVREIPYSPRFRAAETECEKCAVLGMDGTLLVRRFSQDGVGFALAVLEPQD